MCTPLRFAQPNPPPPPPPVTEHEPLHSKSLCINNDLLSSGGANNMQPLSWGGIFNLKTKNSDLFCLCPPPPPSLVGAYHLHPQTQVPYFT